jgi:multiple sugar transport system permease protein
MATGRSGVPVARRPRRRAFAGALTPYLYLLPAGAVLGTWVYRPLVLTFEYSFDNWNLIPTSPRRYVGWSNYHQVLALPQLWQALAVTVFYVVGMLIFGVLVPVIIGALTQQVSARSRAVYRALIFVPVLVSPIVAATLWNFLLAPDGGLVDRGLSLFGLGNINWLVQGTTARIAVVFIAGWKIVGFAALIVSAGLAAISPDYYEAAAIDGAGRSQVFRRVTLPLLSPTILFLVITVVLLSSQLIFPLINSLTQGGPTGSTTDIYYFLYTYGFTSFDVGVASAAAVMFFLFFGAAALLLVRLVDRLSFYDN